MKLWAICIDPKALFGIEVSHSGALVMYYPEQVVLTGSTRQIMASLSVIAVQYPLVHVIDPFGTSGMKNLFLFEIEFDFIKPYSRIADRTDPLIISHSKKKCTTTDVEKSASRIMLFCAWQWLNIFSDL